MSALRVTLLAQADLDSTWLCVAKDRPSAADRLMDRLLRHFSLLSKHPQTGEERLDLAKDVRLSTVGSYVIHGARDVVEEFKRHWPQ